MGHAESKERLLFIDIIKHMLHGRGIKVTSKQLTQFFQFVQEQCLWFPEQGSVNLETWQKVGQTLQIYYTHFGPEKVPVDTFALWNLIRESIAPLPEGQKNPYKYPPNVDESTPLLPPKPPPDEGEVLAAAFKNCVTKDNDSEVEDDSKPEKSNVFADPPLDDKLPRADEDDLDAAAFDYERKKHESLQVLPTIEETKLTKKETLKVPFSMPTSQNHTSLKSKFKINKYTRGPPPPPSFNKIQSLYKKSKRIQGEEDDYAFATCFPVLYEGNFDEEVYWDPLPLKLLKELKKACVDYGPLAPYTITLLDALANRWMTPYDWFQITKACLSGGQYLLWKTEYEDLVAKQYALNKKRDRYAITKDMLLGEGDYDTAEQQMHMGKEALWQVTTCAINAWKALPITAGKASSLSDIRQKSEKPYEDFVSRLLMEIKRVIIDEDAATMLARQLAFENANPICQNLIRPIRKTGNISDFIKQCSDIGPSFMQGIAIAAALKGETLPQCMINMMQKPGIRSKKGNVCYACGEAGHFSRECPKRTSNPTAGGLPLPPTGLGVPRTPCQRCGKGNHWTKLCRSKYHKDGYLLPSNGTSIMPQNGAQITCPSTSMVPATSINMPINHNSGNLSRAIPRAQQTIGAMHQTLNPFLPSDQSASCLEQPQGVQDWTSVPPPQQY